MSVKHIIKNNRFFSEINSSIKAYFLGFIAADGCIQQITKSSKGLSITLSDIDIEILQKLKEELDCTNPIYEFSRPQSYNKNIISNFCRLQIIDKEMVNDLEKLGISERKTFTLDNILINIPKEFRKSFILGYFDGDGCYILPKGKYKNTITKGKVFYPSYSIQIFIRGTENLLKGFIKELEIEKYLFKKYDSTYRLAINHKTEVTKFIKIYDELDFFLKRKYNKIQNRYSLWNTSIVQTISSS